MPALTTYEVEFVHGVESHRRHVPALSPEQARQQILGIWRGARVTSVEPCGCRFEDCACHPTAAAMESTS